MAARLLIHPDAAAHSAKNAPTAPGSAAQSQNRTEEHQMVDTTTPVREVAFAYTPAELNRLISRELCGRLHELCLSLTSNAAFLLANDTVPAAVKRDRVRVYLDVAAQLRLLAVDELDGIAWGAR